MKKIALEVIYTYNKHDDKKNAPSRQEIMLFYLDDEMKEAIKTPNTFWAWLISKYHPDTTSVLKISCCFYGEYEPPVWYMLAKGKYFRDKVTEEINDHIKDFAKVPGVLIGQVSDGYHTFDELYAHRCMLFCLVVAEHSKAWKARKHADGSEWEGWFIAGIGQEHGHTITYHLPNYFWDLCHCREIETAPEFDGHTSFDVLERLKKETLKYAPNRSKHIKK